MPWMSSNSSSKHSWSRTVCSEVTIFSRAMQSSGFSHTNLPLGRGMSHDANVMLQVCSSNGNLCRFIKQENLTFALYAFGKENNHENYLSLHENLLFQLMIFSHSNRKNCLNTYLKISHRKKFNNRIINQYMKQNETYLV